MKILNSIVLIIILLAILGTCGYFIRTQQMLQERYSKILSKWEEQQNRTDEVMSKREEQLELYDKILKESIRQQMEYKEWWEERKKRYEKEFSRSKLRKKFIERNERDKKIYSEEELVEVEELYASAVRKWGTPGMYEDLLQVIKVFPEHNRAGCATLYLAQTSEGKVKEAYLKNAIERYAGCFYGDGVQVGAYACYLLAYYYLERGELEKADRFFAKIKKQYPNSIDHNGELLIRLINRTAFIN